MKDTIAAMIAEVNATHYYFNNLFQLQDGSWRCNLRSDVMIPSWSQFGNGADPVSAVAECLAKLQADKPKFRPTPIAGEIDIVIPEFLRRYKTESIDPVVEAGAVDLVGEPAEADDLVG